jgi:hypothetical protein
VTPTGFPEWMTVKPLRHVKWLQFRHGQPAVSPIEILQVSEIPAIGSSIVLFLCVLKKAEEDITNG